MKVTLKDCQVDAVADVLRNLDDGRDWFHRRGRTTAFSLSATTGSGKTVAAAAVFEALFYGDDTYDFEPDPGAVVVWFSDDPSLNEQSRFRLLEVSDRLRDDLVVVQNSFNRAKFAPGKVYFLNSQKLRQGSLLTRGHDFEAEDRLYGAPLLEMRPDERSATIYDTIKNTIEDPDLTLYLVLDEAHRGMGATKAAQAEKDTIVKRLINGQGGSPPVPVVWGISATVERFTEAMRGATGRTTLTDVVVDPALVQASGLLKDTIVLDIPAEAGAVEQVLLRRGTEKLRNSTKAWTQYTSQQEEAKPVVPLMVFQLPNTPDPADVARHLDTIRDAWPDLTAESFAHVLGEHREMQYGGWSVPYVSPERVQDATHVRVLLAKDAISTGWDCPRAEVMVSLRSARDRTHITQLLGRMVRTPLARRIPGNDRLNAVECILPHFNVRAVTAVADALMNGEDDSDTPLPGRRVLFSPVETTPNPSVPEEVWESFLALPSQSLPRRGVRPVKRLTALAHELAADALVGDAGKKAHAQLHSALDAARARHADKVEAASDAVHTVEGQTLVADMSRKGKSFTQFVEDADVEVIEDAYRRAGRVFSPDLARTYAEYLAAKDTQADSPEEALLGAHAVIAAMALVPEVKDYLDSEADKVAKQWLAEQRISIKSLSDDRQEVYREIREMSIEPQDVDLVRSESRLENSKVREADETEHGLPTRKHHLLAMSNGEFPVDLNGWEEDVLNKEMARPDFVAWYRNPPRASRDSLAIAYQQGDGWKAVRPDFLIVSRRADGSIAASIVDPHGYHLGDALGKLQGLCGYAEQHADLLSRVDAVAKVGNTLRVLDLTSAPVRQAVLDATEPKSLYEGPHASDY